MLLTVELDKTNRVVEVFCDKEGLDVLLSNLKALQEAGGHVHFMTPAWAGSELTEEKQVGSNTLVNHLKVMLRPDDWAKPTAE